MAHKRSSVFAMSYLAVVLCHQVPRCRLIIRVILAGVFPSRGVCRVTPYVQGKIHQQHEKVHNFLLRVYLRARCVSLCLSVGKPTRRKSCETTIFQPCATTTTCCAKRKSLVKNEVFRHSHTHTLVWWRLVVHPSGNKSKVVISDF